MRFYSICDLPLPSHRFNPSLSTAADDEIIRFPTTHQACQEDAARAKLLRRAAKRASDITNKEAAETLANELEYCQHHRPIPATFASYGFVRDMQISVGGGLWKITHELNERFPGRVTARTFTVMREDWDMPLTELVRLDPSFFIRELREDLERCGINGAGGGILCGLHGEYEPNIGIMRVHVHGVAFGESYHVVNRLCLNRKYRAITRRVESLDRVVPSIRMSCQPLNNLPDPLTYLLQPFWPARSEWVHQGVVQRGRKVRIKGIDHARLLIWFDQHAVDDFILRIGVQPTPDGLLLRRPAYTF